MSIRLKTDGKWCIKKLTLKWNSEWHFSFKLRHPLLSLICPPTMFLALVFAVSLSFLSLLSLSLSLMSVYLSPSPNLTHSPILTLTKECWYNVKQKKTSFVLLLSVSLSLPPLAHFPPSLSLPLSHSLFGTILDFFTIPSRKKFPLH